MKLKKEKKSALNLIKTKNLVTHACGKHFHNSFIIQQFLKNNFSNCKI